METREDQLTAVWKALEVIGAAKPDIVEEALAGLEADDPEAYERIHEQFSNSHGWGG